MSSDNTKWGLDRILAEVAAINEERASGGGNTDGRSDTSSDMNNIILNNNINNNNNNMSACMVASTTQSSVPCLPPLSSYLEADVVSEEAKHCVTPPIHTTSSNLIFLTSEGINPSLAITTPTAKTTTAKGSPFCAYTPVKMHNNNNNNKSPECLLPTRSTSPFSAVNGLTPQQQQQREHQE
ncbi:hypothetical protein LSM04_000433 [Trypanosoma melophagium]|uniref:uncharacterized protein n=1 Tax=Trypanosoma melophagium TaxID=715481 RepID=UPI00351A35BE|nr:hypothetical protein LSM04_000433 [Trypanosoma melophagium]